VITGSFAAAVGVPLLPCHAKTLLPIMEHLLEGGQKDLLNRFANIISILL
jgi:hypothetical protein